MLLSCSLSPAQQAGKETTASPDAPQSNAETLNPETKAFFARWGDFYRRDWSPPAVASSEPAPARRGLPSPLDSPPFPNSDWSYGGSPVIGEPDTNSYPLMTAINQAKSRSKIYGWVEPTLNFSTSTNSNAPEANDVYSNRFEMNQLVLYAERLPDSVQRDHVDWGYHLTALYGTDYRYTTGKGYLSGQLLDDHHQYGFDPTLEYVDVYIPQVAQGVNLRLGRFISVPGIEAQLAPNNYIFSHSLLYAIDPVNSASIAEDGLQVRARTGMTERALGIALVDPGSWSWSPDSADLAITLGDSRAVWATDKHVQVCDVLIGRCREQRSPAGTISFSPSYGSAGRFAYVTATGLGGPSGFGKGAPTGAAVGLWESTFRVWATTGSTSAKELTSLGAAVDPQWVDGGPGLLVERSGALCYLESTPAAPTCFTPRFLALGFGNYGQFDWSTSFALAPR